MVSLEVETESTQVDRFPALRGRLEAEARRIDEGNDGHGHAAVWQVKAASTVFKLDQHAKEVLVCNFLRMASRLQSSHHEGVLARNRLHHSLLLLMLRHLVANLIKIQFHITGPVTVAGPGTFKCAVDQSVSVHMCVPIRLQLQSLFYIEAHPSGVNPAIGVVDKDLATSKLIR